MLSVFRPAALLLAFLTVLTGALYPLAITGAAWLAFPSRAAGSLITRNGNVVGSTLIGQPFNDARYFWGRPSATSPTPYNGAASSGSNLGPGNAALLRALSDRAAKWRAAHPAHRASAVPADLLTASGSGLDPHISPAAAHYQLERVAAARHLSQARVQSLIDQHVEARSWWVLGEPRVNVLSLNLALDEVPDQAPN